VAIGIAEKTAVATAATERRSETVESTRRTSNIPKLPFPRQLIDVYGTESLEPASSQNFWKMWLKGYRRMGDAGGASPRQKGRAGRFHLP
jgi:hypothetical protein